MNAEEPDDIDDDDDDDDDEVDDKKDGERDDDGENGWDDEGEDEEDDDQPETWQVVDFPAGNCLDWRDFPAQPGWKTFSRTASRRQVPPRWRP